MRRKSRATHPQLLKRQKTRCIVLKSLETIFLLWKTTCKWKTQGSLTTENEKSFLMLHLWKIIAFVLESNDQQLFCYTKKSKFFPLKWKWWIQYSLNGSYQTERRLKFSRRERNMFWGVLAKGKIFFYFSTSRQFFNGFKIVQGCVFQGICSSRSPKYHVRKSTGTKSRPARGVKEDCSLPAIHLFFHIFSKIKHLCQIVCESISLYYFNSPDENAFI